MDLYMIQKTRCNLNEDHCYCTSSSIGDISANDEVIIGDVLLNNSVSTDTEATEQWIDVLNTEDAVYNGPMLGSSEAFDAIQTCCQTEFPTISIRQRWFPCIRSSCLKVLKILERCALREQIYTCQGNHFPPVSRHIYNKTYNQLNVKCAARKIRNIFSSFSWHTELCYSLHHWCLTNLPEKLLSIYSAALTFLWHQRKITSLISELNRQVKERNLELCSSGNPSIMSILELSENTPIEPNAHGSAEPNDIPSSSTYYSNRSTTTVSNSASPTTAFGSSDVSLRPQDEVILACITYPASKNSSRLSRILRNLSIVGRISVESPEEQQCDVMRVRIGLFIRRVTSLLDEPKHGPIYLVGFGVGALVMLLSVVHMHPVASGPPYLQEGGTPPRRGGGWSFNGLAGLVCIGLPLRGLRGPRGLTNEAGGTVDPLLNLPSIPTLLVVGTASRLGGPQAAYRFRRKLAANQIRLRCQPSSAMGTGSCRGGVQVVVVGAGADHLLRLRPTTCFRWGVTQEAVDNRIVNAVRRFICTVEGSYSRPCGPGSSHRSQSLLPLLDPLHHQSSDTPTGSPYSLQTSSPATASPGHPALTGGSASHFPASVMATSSSDTSLLVDHQNK